jgi:hypothetical protein
MSSSEPPDVARLRAALASLSEQPGWPSADAERIFSALHGNLSAEERRAVVDELVQNPDAAAVWRMARELAPEEPAVAPPARRGGWTWASVAAVAVLALGLGWMFQPWQSFEEPAYRSVEQRSIASLVPADTPLRRAQPVLRWTAVEGARYRVRVLTAELDLLEEAEDLAAPQYALSADVLRRLPSGARILWQVEARIPGTAGLVSPTFSVRLE